MVATLTSVAGDCRQQTLQPQSSWRLLYRERPTNIAKLMRACAPAIDWSQADAISAQSSGFSWSRIVDAPDWTIGCMDKPVIAALLEDGEVIETIDHDWGEPRLHLTADGRRLVSRIGRASSNGLVGLGRLRRRVASASPRQRF